MSGLSPFNQVARGDDRDERLLLEVAIVAPDRPIDGERRRKKDYVVLIDVPQCVECWFPIRFEVRIRDERDVFEETIERFVHRRFVESGFRLDEVAMGVNLVFEPYRRDERVVPCPASVLVSPSR